MNRYQQRPVFDDRHLAFLDIETVSGEEMEDGGFPPWPTHTPVVASVLTADLDAHGIWHFAMESMRFGEDDEPLERIDQLLRGRACVTFSGRGFDLPVLMLTAQATRNFCLPALTAAATESRYASARHIDLADKYSNYGAARGASLASLCESLGVAAKVSAHGNEVGQMYDEGRITEIVQYCEGDVSNNLHLHANSRAMEKGDASYHAALVWQFSRWVHDQELEHLKPFAEVELLEELLRQSLIGQIDASLHNAQLDAALTAKRALDSTFGEATSY